MLNTFGIPLMLVVSFNLSLKTFFTRLKSKLKEKIILSNIKTVKKILLKTTPVFLLGKSNG